MLEHLINSSLSAEYLDEAVHEAAANLASNANNGGIREQVEFLKIMAGFSESDILTAIMTKALKPGVMVDVSEPKHEVSPHIFAFKGVVVAVLENHVEVRDPMDAVWNISFDEIERFYPCRFQIASQLATTTIHRTQ